MAEQQFFAGQRWRHKTTGEEFVVDFVITGVNNTELPEPLLIQDGHEQRALNASELTTNWTEAPDA